jgi:IS5 family transposase
MRWKKDPQLNILHALSRHAIGKELLAISDILDENREMLDWVHRDLVGVKAAQTGREGMTAEQVLRAAILKQYRSLSYEELAFHLEDSASFRAFARLKPRQHPGSSTLQENIKAIGENTWEAVNRLVVNHAARNKFERGRTVRIDSTGVETDIHHPTDSTLLYDGIRVISRLLHRGKGLRPIPAYRFSDHQRAAKRRVVRILNARKEEDRGRRYRELLEIAGWVRGYAMEAIGALRAYRGEDLGDVVRARVIADDLERLIELFDRVIDQTRRRVILGQKVPASEKIVSFFECHTDIIEKGNRETAYGHKVFLVGGKSGLILDCAIERGNPADSSMFVPMMERQEEIFGRPPRQASGDGGFASKENLRAAKRRGIRDVCFSKGRGLSVLDMVKSSWVYKKLRNFRAGIEAVISCLKRAFSLSRCCWSGWDGFVQYVQSAVFSYNLLVLARLKIAAG